MEFFTFPRIVEFTEDELQHYASFEHQIEDENPILLARFIDCVR